MRNLLICVSLFLLSCSKQKKTIGDTQGHVVTPTEKGILRITPSYNAEKKKMGSFIEAEYWKDGVIIWHDWQTIEDNSDTSAKCAEIRKVFKEIEMSLRPKA